MDPEFFYFFYLEKSSESGKVFDVNDNDVTLESEGVDELRGDDNSGEVEGNPEYFFIPSGKRDVILCGCHRNFSEKNQFFFHL